MFELSLTQVKTYGDGAATMKPVCKQVLSGNISNGYISVYHIYMDVNTNIPNIVNYKYSYYLPTSFVYLYSVHGIDKAKVIFLCKKYIDETQ